MMTKGYVVVTGGSKGIGRAIVDRCVEDGFTPICVARSLYQGRYADRVVSIRCDLAQVDGARSVFEELDARKIVAHYLVNNAGALGGKHLHALGLDEIELQIQMNTRLPMLMSRELLQRLGAGGDLKEGVIVNISSVSALSTSSDPVYGATKASITGLTRCLALHYGPKIRVNAVAPGFIRTTEMGARVPADRAKGYIEGSLTKKELTPDSVAEMVSYLLSDRAINITGVTYEICNGSYLR
jgi:NAD(P)-dependent dehydrogenase (short-subunit alcohol dehydrogenase family)